MDELTERAKKAGLVPVVYEINKPKPTSGTVVALGTDPFVQEHVKVGDVVMFSRHAGVITTVEGEQFRTLEFNEITGIIRDE